jgi:hypothetical protein
MNCNNELILCIDNRKNPTNKKNIIFDKMFDKLMKNIENNKNLSTEDIDFIESISDEKKMKIIKLYDKKLKSIICFTEELMQTKYLR